MGTVQQGAQAHVGQEVLAAVVLGGPGGVQELRQAAQLLADAQALGGPSRSMRSAQ